MTGGANAFKTLQLHNYGISLQVHPYCMRSIKLLSLLGIWILPVTALTSFTWKRKGTDRFITYTVNPAKTTLRFFWKDGNGKPIKSLGALRTYCALQNQDLLFAMNGGMYTEDRSPLGLYIENGKILHRINAKKGNGNFYMQPNGVLFIRKDKSAGITTTSAFTDKEDILYATQSGPMLLVNGKINASFKKGSANINIRNGAGLLPGNVLLFAMSTGEVSLYDFASFFQQAGCSNALYLDGFVSRTYLPAKKWLQTGGDFGVMIGATENR